jgi:hypothetical protein
VRSKHPNLRTTGTEGRIEQSLVLALTARDHDEAAQLADIVTAARSALREQREAMHAVIEALLPPGRMTLSPALVQQARHNVTARAELADQFGLLTSAEVAALAGSRARNAGALASRWRREGRLFAVKVDGVIRYPGFQLDADGRVVPAVRDVLGELAGKLNGWELALWFTGANGWLGGLRPVDVLTSAPEQVTRAAHALAHELLA